MAKTTMTLQNKEKNLFEMTAEYTYVARKAKILGWIFIFLATICLLFGFFLNYSFLNNSITSIVNIIPINVFLLAGATLFSTLGFFYLRENRSINNKAWDIYKDFAYKE